MPEGPKEWEEKPNGCASEFEWKKCTKKGYLKRNSHCYHPEMGDWVSPLDGVPTCPLLPDKDKMPAKDYIEEDDK